MSQRLPSTDALLGAATDYLEHELLPTLSGYHRFQTRVSVNVLRVVVRELQQAAAFDDAERARLGALLGTADDGRDSAALEAELTAAITTGRLGLDDPGLVDHLRQSLADSLAINNPKWIATDPTSLSKGP